MHAIARAWRSSCWWAWTRTASTEDSMKVTPRRPTTSSRERSPTAPASMDRSWRSLERSRAPDSVICCTRGSSMHKAAPRPLNARLRQTLTYRPRHGLPVKSLVPLVGCLLALAGVLGTRGQGLLWAPVVDDVLLDARAVGVCRRAAAVADRRPRPGL